MTAPLGRLALAALGLAVADGAEARELRHPERGTPAFTVQVPDDWQHAVDPDNNLIVTSADTSTSFVFTWGNFSGELENAATLMLRSANATPPAGKTPASISGLPGFSFESTMAATKPPLRLKLTIVRVGPKGFGSCTQLERETNSPQQRQGADAVMRSVTVLGAPQPR
jgi:hypothetical protein